MSEELKPCPRCGEVPDIICSLGNYWIFHCGFKTPLSMDRELVIDYWNYKLTPDRREIAALKKQVDGLIGKDGRDYCTKIETERDALNKERDDCGKFVGELLAERDALKKELANEKDNRAEAETARRYQSAARALNLLRIIMENATVYEQPEDGTRQWCSELSMYLRGHIALVSLLTKDEKARIDKILAETEGPKE